MIDIDQKRSIRGLSILPDDAQIWCCLENEPPHAIGVKRKVRFYNTTEIDSDGDSPAGLARCEKHQAMVMWLVLGSTIAPKLENSS